MKHRRRKIITRAIVFLLLGAIVNVAVAWGCVVVGGIGNADAIHSPLGITGSWDGFIAGLPFRSLDFRRYVDRPDGLLWPGFAINAIFYAAILWMLFAAPLAFRRRRRIKRGLCPACAYPIGSSDNCTECGKPVMPAP